MEKKNVHLMSTGSKKGFEILLIWPLMKARNFQRIIRIKCNIIG